ncbi:hypothetical protein L9F63_005749, partial [Diploptera punctata]
SIVIRISCVVLGIVTLILFLVVPPFHRGFYCDDESIRYPVPETETVNVVTLALVSVGVPVIAILITEAVQAGISSPTTLVFFGWTPQVWMVQSYAHIGVFLFGAGIEASMVEAAKRLVGRLRPHFFYACLPVGIDCSPDHIHQYQLQYTCSGDADIVLEARMSFPSGHSSLAFYAATFLVMYLQNRMTWQPTKLLRHLVQFLAVTAAWATALTRVSDYMHHWSDVLAGISIGTLVAILTVVFMSNLRRSRADDEAMESLCDKRTIMSYNATESRVITNNDLC